MRLIDKSSAMPPSKGHTNRKNRQAVAVDETDSSVPKTSKHPEVPEYEA
jgi:hypothetical protein